LKKLAEQRFARSAPKQQVMGFSCPIQFQINMMKIFVAFAPVLFD
jgi:hypothetical protein